MKNLQRWDWLGALVLLAGISACQRNSTEGASSTSSSIATSSQSKKRTPTALAADASLRARLAAVGGVASSVDRDGTPKFVWATASRAAPAGATPEAAARAHLERYSRAQGMSSAILATARVARVQDFGPGGRIAVVRQEVGGVEVYRSAVKVLMRQNGDLVAMSGRLNPAAARASSRSFRMPPAEALSRAIAKFDPKAAIRAGDFTEMAQGEGGDRRFQLATSAGLRLPAGARVKKVYFPEADRVVPAYFIEFYAGRTGADSEAWRYVISADDGQVLDRRNLTAYESFNYRVWAEPVGDHRPLDGPQSDFTPHPTGTPDNSDPVFIAPNLVSIDGFNTNPYGQPDPWLPNGAVQTLGNNVDAYADYFPPDGYSNGELRAEVNAENTFDYTFDTLADPVGDPNVDPTQTLAAVTQLFYNVNWLHDYYYDSGFNEVAGNAQRDNYRRGGEGGDIFRAEAQDNYFGGSRNNANQSTPSDGFSPRMQMYVFTGPETRRLTLSSTGGEVTAGRALFGPASFDISAMVVLADDGDASPPPNPPTPGGSVNDGCQPLVNDVGGRIALIDRGTCSFKTKALNAQNAGAVGMLLADNRVAGGPPTLGDDSSISDEITIGVLSMTQADGTALKTALEAGDVTATLFRRTDTDRDGTIDNTIVAHEWGHYLHHRLADCGAQQCAAISEGWGDFVALHMISREGDNLDGAYALAIYATKAFGDSGYFGIRRLPYSVTPTINALSLRHITDNVALPSVPHLDLGNNAEVHNAGEIWASMMWEAYISLQKARGSLSFEQVRRRMADYVVAGLQLTPVDATFTEQRDAILAAVAARSAADLAVVANAFARRGAGSCAVAPADPDSQDNAGVVEGFELKPRIEIGEISVTDEPRTCDRDGRIDAGETGRLVVTVHNGGAVAMSGATLRVTSTTTGVTFPGGATVDVPTIAPFASTDVMVDVALAAMVTGIQTLAFDVQVENAAACQTQAMRQVSARGNIDDVPQNAATDSVESDQSPWARTGFEADQVWLRFDLSPTNRVWHGNDAGAVSDTQLESPDLQVNATGNFQISFMHRYSFESGDDGTGAIGYYDGGVIELSQDAGATWTDISDYADPGYGGALYEDSGNPLAGRQAYVAQGASGTAFAAVSLNLGTALAGKTVRIRFRIATDQSVGDYGWDIDEIAVSGISNRPFPSVIADPGNCGTAIAANAGPDRTVPSGQVVVLDASASTNSLGRPVTYTWTQMAGTPTVQLSGEPGGTSAAFTAPSVSTSTRLTFQVRVTDGIASAMDTVDVTVTPGVVANAGPDQTAVAGTTVLLNALASTSTSGAPLSYTWTQAAGTPVQLTTTTGGAAAAFTAPAVSAPTRLTFQVAVTDGAATATDTVDVMVTPGANPPKKGCSVAGDTRSAPVTAMLLFAAPLLLHVSRRRRARRS